MIFIKIVYIYNVHSSNLKYIVQYTHIYIYIYVIQIIQIKQNVM